MKPLDGFVRFEGWEDEPRFIVAIDTSAPSASGSPFVGRTHVMPRFDLFPWLTHAAARFAESRYRVRTAWRVLRYGEDEW